MSAYVLCILILMQVSNTPSSFLQEVYDKNTRNKDQL
jgi:hypothetical protein